MSGDLPQFADEETARFFLERIRWGDGPVVCPRCEGIKIGRIRTRGLHKCLDCRYQFTVTTGTVFDKHKLAFRDITTALFWFEATNGKGRIIDLQRSMSCTYKTALVLKQKMWEAYVDGNPMRTGLSILTRWYWEGFNWLEMSNGILVKVNRKTKERRIIYTKATPPSSPRSDEPGTR